MYRNELNGLEIDLGLCLKYLESLPNANPDMKAFLNAALTQCYRVNHNNLDETYLLVKEKTKWVREAIHKHSLLVVSRGFDAGVTR